MKYLGKLYPVQPWSSLEIYQLDLLDYERDDTPCPSYWDEIREMYGIYRAAKAHKHMTSDLVAYNNSWWFIGEAETHFEFADLMYKELEKDRHEHL